MTGKTWMYSPGHRRLGVLFACVLSISLIACTPKESEDGNKEEASQPAAAEGAGESAEKGGEATEDPAAGTDEVTSADQKKGTEQETGTEKKGEAKAAKTIDDGDRIPAGETRHYGDEFTIDDSPMTVESALAKVDDLVGKPIKLEGQVKTACRKKGCWMQIVTHSEGAEPLRVTFKDYGFFVPKHADGSHAVMEGEFVKETMKEAMRKHLAEDANKPQEEIDAIKGDVDIVKFVATAVDLTGPEAQ